MAPETGMILPVGTLSEEEKRVLQEKEEERQVRQRQRLLRETRPFWVSMLVLLLSSLLLVWSWHFAGAVRAAYLYLALGLSCLSGGSLVGFLFGIPNTNQAKRNLADMAPAGTATAIDQPSTNLEQVSDWLTKIIIGVGLVETTRIKNALGRLGQAIGHETEVSCTVKTALAQGAATTAGVLPGSAVVPQLLVVLFGAAGFACGYIWTRLSYSTTQIMLDFNLRQRLEQQVMQLTGTVQKVIGTVKAVDAKVDTKTDELDAKTAAIAATAGVAKDVATGIATNERAKAVTSATQAPAGVATAEFGSSPELAQWQQNLQQFLDAAPNFATDDTHDIFEKTGLLLASQDGRTLRVIKVAELEKNTFYFKVEVVGTPDNPLTGEVTLLLHPTYRRRAVRLLADTLNQPEGLATYSFPATGSFTVVAMMNNGRTILGFDLSKISGLPLGW